MPIEPGARLDDHELLRPLGAGGMGEVWLALDTRLGRRVALKLLPSELTRDPARVARFEQEARAASTLSHPNVCHIYSLGRTHEGQRYIAMELVEGHTLREKLRGGAFRSVKLWRSRPRSRWHSSQPTPVGSCIGISSLRTSW
jgi:eukaryotic-like serine/threonine-protein kinase